MPHHARGAALVDSHGLLVTADPGFCASLGLGASPAPAALQEAAAAAPALAAVLAGTARAAADLDGPLGPVQVERWPAPEGALLVVRGRDDGERLELSVSSEGMAVVAGGLAHEVKNVLNAMTLQVALAQEKLGDGEGARAAGGHLATLQEQVSKVNELMRRFRDATAPSTSYDLEGVDLGAALADVASLFGPHLRRSGIACEVAASPGVAVSAVRPARAVRLLLGVFGRAALATPEGGRVAARAAAAPGAVLVTIEHTADARGADLRYDNQVAAEAARALGGSLELAREGEQERVTVRLPRAELT